MSSRCYCRACSDRDERRFWRIVEPLRAGQGNTLNLPPVPEWDGEPNELQLSPKEGAR